LNGIAAACSIAWRVVEMEDAWEADVRDFILEHLTPRRRRVLEVGCGEGWLTRAIAEAGHDAKGIDPEAPEGSLFERVALEMFTGSEPYDAIVAVLSLHHIADASAALNKIKSLLKVKGQIVVVEFAWENLDDATLSWCLERLPSDLDIEGNWLQECCLHWHAKLQQGDLTAQDHVGEWGHRQRLHPGKEVLGFLREGFDQRFFQWTPYLYPGLGGVSAEEERAAIDRGEIRPVGYRFIGNKT
jgi:SAM-dependent methyltransferase